MRLLRTAKALTLHNLSSADMPCRQNVWGNVIGITFDDEDETLLFSPVSGDLLICNTPEWEKLIEASPTKGFESELRQTLERLGLSQT